MYCVVVQIWAGHGYQKPAPQKESHHETDRDEDPLRRRVVPNFTEVREPHVIAEHVSH